MKARATVQKKRREVRREWIANPVPLDRDSEEQSRDSKAAYLTGYLHALAWVLDTKPTGGTP